MTIRFKNAFFIFLGLLIIWLVFAERAALTPFILGALFAYIFNPIVVFVSKNVKLPRELSANIVFLLLMALTIFLAVILTQRIIAESDDVRGFVNYFLFTARSQINSLPGWIRPTVYDFLISIQKSRAVGTTSLLPFFPQAVSRIVNIVIFFVSGYYFLREGNKFYEKIILLVPKAYKVDVEILFRKISGVLGEYLRGQIFLVFLMSAATFISLSILGVRFALFLGIFSGFAEIVPIVGPIIAAVLSMTVVILTGNVNFGLSPFNGALVIALVYFVIRHIEDYLVIPHVMGKITKLSPFVIFFAVVMGGHLWGILGLILAVPITAIIKILLEYFLDQLNKKPRTSML